MTMTIQNESKKIAVTETQLESMRTDYRNFISKQTQPLETDNTLTNNDVVNQIVNSSTTAPQDDVLIADAPVNATTSPTEPTNMFDTVPIVDNPTEVKVQESKMEQSVVTPEPQEDVVAKPLKETSNHVQDSSNNITVVAVDIAGLKKQLLDEYYELQIHVQEYGVRLEEYLEKIDNLSLSNQNIKSIAETLPYQESKAVETVQPKPQEISTPPAAGNIFDAPKSELATNNTVNQPLSQNYSDNINIFDQISQTPSNGEQKLRM